MIHVSLSARVNYMQNKSRCSRKPRHLAKAESSLPRLKHSAKAGELPLERASYAPGYAGLGPGLLALLLPSLAWAAEPTDPYAVWDQLGESLALIEENWVEPSSRENLAEGALRGLVSNLDAHSSYLSPRELELFESDTSGNFGGIGVEVDYRKEGPKILSVVEGGPADRGGLRPGDLLIAVDGQLLADFGMDELVDRMRGPVGSELKLWLTRDGQRLEFKLRREQIHIKSVVPHEFDGGVLYLGIKAFQENTWLELRQALADFRKKHRRGPSGLLLDLRGNPGGLVHEAEAVADEFLSEGIIYQIHHRGDVVRRSWATPGGAYKSGPLVVLLDENTASAAELLALALQDHRRGLCLGRRTFGKGSVQSLYFLSGGGALKLTTALYAGPRGSLVQGRGVQPELVAPAEQAPGFVVREDSLPGYLRPQGGAEPPHREAEPLSKPPEEATKGQGSETKGQGAETMRTEFGPRTMQNVGASARGSQDQVLELGYLILLGEKSPASLRVDPKARPQP